MGYRSTLISQSYSGNLPKWFKEKYVEYISFTGGLIVSSKREAKFDNNDFFEDYQKAIEESGFWERKDKDIIVVVLSEDGVVTKIKISKESIYYVLMAEDIYIDKIWAQG